MAQMDNKYYSQYGQDKYLNEKIFRGKPDGFFVEVGAHDGISFSNGYFFEKNLGWKGICIEPNPYRYAELCANRKSLNLNVCIARQEGVVDFTLITGYGEMLSGITDQYDNKHVERIKATLVEKGGEMKNVPVKSIPLKTIFRENNVSEVSFISIDVEGGEMEVLESIDFTATHIKCFAIENNYHTKEIPEFMRSKGYRIVKRLSCDEIYLLGRKKFIFF